MTQERRLRPRQAIATQFFLGFVSGATVADDLTTLTGLLGTVPPVEKGSEGYSSGCCGISIAGGGADYAAAGVFLNGFPQLIQNLLVSGFFVPHSPQNMVILPAIRSNLLEHECLVTFMVITGYPWIPCEENVNYLSDSLAF